MTDATKTAPVTRKLPVQYRGRPLVITVHPLYLEIKELGRRDSCTVDWETIYDLAQKKSALRKLNSE